MSATADIVEKIKKLLRLSRSSNPHEAQLALARALQLAREHGIAVDGLDTGEPAKEKTCTHRETEAESRLSYDKRYAWAVCRMFFNVDTLEVTCLRPDRWGRTVLGIKVSVVGTATDIEIALYVFGFLTQHFSYCWRKYRGRLRNRHVFVYGMYGGIVSKLIEQMPPKGSPEAKGQELSVDVRGNYIAAVYGETTSKKMGKPDLEAKAALNAGWQHGRDTTINSALKPAPAAAPLALA